MVNTSPAGNRNTGTESSPVSAWLGEILVGYFPAECAAITKKSGNPVLHFAGKIEMAKSTIRQQSLDFFLYKQETNPCSCWRGISERHNGHRKEKNVYRLKKLLTAAARHGGWATKSRSRNEGTGKHEKVKQAV